MSLIAFFKSQHYWEDNYNSLHHFEISKLNNNVRGKCLSSNEPRIRYNRINNS